LLHSTGNENENSLPHIEEERVIKRSERDKINEG